MDLSVIIVSFNTREKLQKCLQSVFRSATNYQFEVWVVDNASGDGSCEMARTDFPAVKFIENKENLGFAKANNQAIREMRGKGETGKSRYILLLNSDVEISPDTFDKMIAFMDNDHTVGISGCKVLKPNGKLDLACRRSFPDLAGAIFRFTGLSFLFPKSRFSSYNLTFLSEDQTAEVDSVMGAFLLIRRETADKIGPLDENYFMYGEDMDWCYRAKRAGYKVLYAPITTVVHFKGSSSRKQPKKALYDFHRAMQIFYDNHYRQRHNFLVNMLVKIGIWGRYIIKLTENGLRREKYVSK